MDFAVNRFIQYFFPLCCILSGYEDVSEELVAEKEENIGESRNETDDEEMEKMLSELTSIVPPTSVPPDWSLSTTSGDERGEEVDRGETAASEEDNGSLDTLAVMRKRLEESMLDDDSVEDTPGRGNETSKHSTTNEHSKEETDCVAGESDTAIIILPPTPTVTKDMDGGMAVGDGWSQALSAVDSLAVGTGSSAGTVELGTPSLPVAIGGGRGSREVGESPGAVSKSMEDSTDQGPFFSPASLHNSPDLKKVGRVMWEYSLTGPARFFCGSYRGGVTSATHIATHREVGSIRNCHHCNHSCLLWGWLKSLPHSTRIS